jgi:hypothetical protein
LKDSPDDNTAGIRGFVTARPALSGTNGRPTRTRAPEAEFFDLIYELDPGAANDDYYVTSADFLALQSELRSKLIRGLFQWAACLCAAIGAAAVLYG